MLPFTRQTTARASASWAVVCLWFASALSAPLPLALRLAGRQYVRLLQDLCALQLYTSPASVLQVVLPLAEAACTAVSCFCRFEGFGIANPHFPGCWAAPCFWTYGCSGPQDLLCSEVKNGS